MITTAYLPLLLCLLGQAPPAAAAKADDPAARLEVMKRSLAIYDVRSVVGPRATYQLMAEPVSRFTNPISGMKDGAVFLWLNEAGRPEVAVQVYQTRRDIWNQEFSSLSTIPLVATSPRGEDWKPSRVGVEFRPVPGAPRPAATPEQRLRQMRALTVDFTAEDNHREKSWQQLRLLSKPFARYGKVGSDLIDGALFAYVLTTDPEAFLMLEARGGGEGARWYYAFAPMTSYALRGSWRGAEVWTLPHRPSPIARKPEEAFHIRSFDPEDLGGQR